MAPIDPIEMSETLAEDRYHAARRGLEDGYYRCPGCDEVRSDADAYPISASPYAEAVCGACHPEGGGDDGAD